MSLEEFYKSDFELIENFMIAMDRLTNGATDDVDTDDVVTLMARVQGVDC